VKRSAYFLKQAALNGLKRDIDTMVERSGQVVRQAKARIFGGDTHAEGKIVSVFEPSTEVIRKPSKGMRCSRAARQTWWQRTTDSSRRRTKLPRTRRA